MLAAPLDVVLPKGRKANTHGSPLSPSSSVVSHGRHVRGPFPTSVLLHTSPLHSSGLPHSLGRGFSTFTCLHSQPMAPLAAPTSLGALSMNLILTDLWKKASELGSGNQPEAGEKSSLEQITWLTAESKLTAQAWSDQPGAQKKLSPPHPARPSLSAAANGRQAGRQPCPAPRHRRHRAAVSAPWTAACAAPQPARPDARLRGIVAPAGVG